MPKTNNIHHSRTNVIYILISSRTLKLLYILILEMRHVAILDLSTQMSVLTVVTLKQILYSIRQPALGDHISG